MEKTIIKQDINFLDKPLWFQNVKHDGLGFVWTDIEGYEYRSGYKTPDKVDIVILLYMLMKSQKQKYKADIELTRYEILKECGLDSNSQYYERLKDSLKRWKNVAIEFKGTFYDGKKYLTMLFGIIDDAEIDEETGQVTVNFNEKWLLKIKESTFFKYLNFEYYKALKRPLSRRLYEILCKTFKGRDEWSVGLAKLGTKLTLSGREVSYREGKEIKTGKVIFASDVLVAVKPAVNEINRLAETAGIGEKTGIPPEDIFGIEYEITGEKQERIISFRKIRAGRQKDVKEETPQPVIHEPPDPRYDELAGMIPEKQRERESVKELVRQYFKDSGFEYVKWNILYANNNAKDNYLSYLSLSLKHNWGLRFREETELLRQAEEERLRDEAEKQRKVREAAEQRAAEQRKRAEDAAEYEKRKAAEIMRLTEFYDSLSGEEKRDVEIKTEQALNGFERNRLAKHRLKGGKMPVLLACSVENARLKVLREMIKNRTGCSYQMEI